MPTRPELPVFRAWLPFFVVSTALTYLASWVVALAMRVDAEQPPDLGDWVASLLIPVPITLFAFQWTVIKHFAAIYAAGRARPLPPAGLPAVAQ